VRKIVVVGSSAAGMMAAVSAAQQDQQADVTVVTKDHPPYRRPAIPALIAGYIKSPEEARILSDNILKRHHIKMICPAQVTDINTKEKNILFLSRGKQHRINYDALVIATGGSPLVPKIKGVDKKGVCTFTTYESALEIIERAEQARSAVVIGAGFIALEIAEALMHRSLEVYFNVRSRILRKLLEPELSELLARRFEQQGLKMLTGEAVSEIGGKDSVKYVVHKDRKIAAELVVMGTGVKPDVKLAEKCGIALGRTGAIKVDRCMQTSAKDVYAAGDCAENPDLGSKQFVYTPVGSIGACASRIAGRNAAGAEIETDGFLRAQADEILGVQIFSIGHSTTSAKETGLEVKVYDLPQPESMLSSGKAAFEAGKILTDIDDNMVGAQLIAEKFGSQFACQLYRGVLQGEKRRRFLKHFTWPRAKVTDTLSNLAKSTVIVETLGTGAFLKIEK